jgi:hypothetical protein
MQEFAKIGELTVQGRDYLRVCQRIATTRLTAPDRLIQWRAEHDIVDHGLVAPERRQEPGSDDAVDDDEIAPACIGVGSGCKGLHHNCILSVRCRQEGCDSALPDRMPEIVGMEMDLGRSRQVDEGTCRRCLAGTGRAGEDEDLAGAVEHLALLGSPGGTGQIAQRLSDHR